MAVDRGCRKRGWGIRPLGFQDYHIPRGHGLIADWVLRIPASILHRDADWVLKAIGKVADESAVDGE